MCNLYLTKKLLHKNEKLAAVLRSRPDFAGVRGMQR